MRFGKTIDGKSFLDAKALSEAMLEACRAARPFVGATSPNPPVGAAALDESGRVIALAAHPKAGEPHAEAALLRHCQAEGILAAVHAVCVTLEPCNHHGRTPPCCDALIAAGIKRVAIGAKDPNPAVRGGGIAALRNAGIEVETGIEEDACRRLACGFLKSVECDRPFVVIKTALDKNGSAIPPKGSKTFTSPSSLAIAHRLRKRADAILTGSGTVLADDPAFTVRLVTDHPDKIRRLAILDRRRRVPYKWLKDAEKRGFAPLIGLGVAEVLQALRQDQAREVLVEAGPQATKAVLESGQWDMLVEIRQGCPEDKIEVRFNPDASAVFSPENFILEDFLP